MGEGVESSQSPDRLVARPQVEVVRIPQDRLNTNLRKFFGGKGLNRSLCSHGKKGGGGERAMVCFNPPQPSFGEAILFDNLKPKSHK